MPKIVISDTSSLIVLQNIEQLDLLKKVYGELLTTPEIAEEWRRTSSVGENNICKR